MIQQHQDFLTQALADYQKLQAEITALNNETHLYRNAMQAAMHRAQGFDAIITTLYRDEPNLPFAIVATGGYGRGRLAPYSDIDLLFIHHKDADLKQVTPLMERCLYVLWDLHVKLGYKIGTAKEIMDAVFVDITAATSLVDMRFIMGNQPCYDAFVSFSIAEMAIKLPRQKFIEAKIQETQARHSKQGESRYLLEPNIKEGRGGLRDLDMLHWVCHYQPETGLLNCAGALKQVLGEQLYRDYQSLEDYLWNVRFLLHHISERSGEILTLDLQSEIAEKMAYRLQENNIGKRVERFMRHYFLHVSQVGFLARTVVADIELSENRKIFALPQKSYQEIEGFHRQGRFLSFADKDAPKTNPLIMLQIFMVAMRHNLRLHPQTLQAMHNYRYLLGACRDDADANQLFVAILTQGARGVWALKRMNDTGLLGAFVPAFKNIIAQMQFNRYHYYTTDTHTFNALNILASIENGESHAELPVITSLMRDKNFRRKLLYCALFLHDIGKGQKEHHSIVGENVALQLCPNLGFDKEETAMIAWLVRQHLVMSDTAFKRDLLDRKTIADFASLVENQERLQLLFMLTVIDIKAVSPVSWNSYKHGLLHDLYARTYDMISQQERFGYYLDDELAMLRAQLIENLQAESAQAENYVKHLPESYLHAYAKEDIIRQAQIIFALEANREENSIAPYDTQHYHISIKNEYGESENNLRIGFIVKWHPQCFTDCAAVIALASGNIYQANLFRVSGQYAVIYFVGHFANVKRVQQILPEIANNILGSDKTLRHGDIEKLNQKMAEQPKGEDNQYVAQSSIVRHGEIKFHLNVSDLYTVIEISAHDRQGLLYQIARALSTQNIQINAAKIATFGEEAVDSFYVKDSFGLKIEQPEVLNQVRQKLQNVIQKYTIA